MVQHVKNLVSSIHRRLSADRGVGIALTRARTFSAPNLSRLAQGAPRETRQDPSPAAARHDVTPPLDSKAAPLDPPAEVRRHVLADGRVVGVRRLHASDADKLHAFLSGLPAKAFRARFPVKHVGSEAGVTVTHAATPEELVTLFTMRGLADGPKGHVLMDDKGGIVGLMDYSAHWMRRSKCEAHAVIAESHQTQDAAMKLIVQAIDGAREDGFVSMSVPGAIADGPAKATIALRSPHKLLSDDKGVQAGNLLDAVMPWSA